MAGHKLKDLGFTEEIVPKHYSVKEAVFPFIKFPGVDPLLGPEMKSTGEVMGIDVNFGRAFYKAETASGTLLPESGMVFLSLNDSDKPAGIAVAKRFKELGLRIAATYGTAEYLQAFGVSVDETVAKVSDSKRHPDDRTALDLIEAGLVTFVVNTPRGSGSRSDGMLIRIAANVNRVSSVTTVDAALAAAEGVVEVMRTPTSVRSLQEYHAR